MRDFRSDFCSFWPPYCNNVSYPAFRIRSKILFQLKKRFSLLKSIHRVSWTPRGCKNRRERKILLGWVEVGGAGGITLRWDICGIICCIELCLLSYIYSRIMIYFFDTTDLVVTVYKLEGLRYLVCCVSNPEFVLGTEWSFDRNARLF